VANVESLLLEHAHQTLRDGLVVLYQEHVHRGTVAAVKRFSPGARPTFTRR
jgi:hypothetical protein